MKTKRFIIFGIISVMFSFVFVSCLEDNENVNDDLYQFIYEPIIVAKNDGETIMKTQYGDILAPQLSQANPRDYYLVNFMMDKTIQPYTAFRLQTKQMGVDTIKVVSSIPSDDYDAPIADVKIYLQDPNVDILRSSPILPIFLSIDSTFFINPYFNNHSVHELKFLLLTNATDQGDQIPSLYLHARPTTKDISKMCYGLNMSTLLQQPEYAGKKSIQFNLKFKSGVDGNGNDVYKDYKHNPIEISY